MTKKTYKIQGMDCDSCAKMIELDLEDVGISSKCDYSKQVLEVEFAENISEEEIKKIVSDAGYTLLNE